VAWLGLHSRLILADFQHSPEAQIAVTACFFGLFSLAKKPSHLSLKHGLKTLFFSAPLKSLNFESSKRPRAACRVR